MKRFSDRFPIFFDWKDQARNSDYAKRIERLHFWFPQATLTELSGKKKLPKIKLPIHLVDTRGLKPKERALRNQSLNALSRIRRGEKPLDVIEDIGLNRKTLLNHLGNNIKIKKDTIEVAKSDKIPRELIIKEDGREHSIIVKNSKDASIIGRYHNEVRNFLNTGNSSELKRFQKTRIKDADGRVHRLETNSNRIIDIEDRKEEPEAFEIYKT